MASALRPGGVLLAEEGDYGLFSYSGHPDAAWSTEQWRRRADRLRAARTVDYYLGRRLPGLVAGAGLTVTGGDVDATVARHGDAPFEWQRVSSAAAAPALIHAGHLTADEHDRVMRMMDCPTTTFVSGAVISVWATRPASDASP